MPKFSPTRKVKRPDSGQIKTPSVLLVAKLDCASFLLFVLSLILWFTQTSAPFNINTPASRKVLQAAVSWLERMDLSDWASKNLETLSKGNQQKIQIIQAVINDPEILVFDEPFSGLDPVNSKILKDIIREFIERGKIVIFSSHQMSYVEEFCDDVCFIKKGKIILSENLNELKAELGKNKLRINIDLEKEPARELLKRCDAVEDVLGDRTGIILQIKNERNSNEILKYLIEKGCTVKSFTPYRPSLEEIFIELDEEVEDEAV